MASAIVQNCPKTCRPLCAEIAKVKRLQVEAKMATEVYKPMGQRHVPGYTEVTDPAELEKLDLIREDLEPADSEFRAAVFRQNGTKNYMVAFKGTTMDSMSDWMANGGQGTVGYSNYYSRAKLIGRDVAAKVGGGDVAQVKFVGHSLGGGLASAAAHATGQPATTFNAAGLHLFNRNIFSPPPIDAVRVNGEILTGLQNTMRGVPILVPGASGTPYRLPPPPNMAAAIPPVKLDGWDALFPARAIYKYGKKAASHAKAAVARAVDLHLMSSVNPALEQQRDMLQKKADAQGCRC